MGASEGTLQSVTKVARSASRRRRRREGCLAFSEGLRVEAAVANAASFSPVSGLTPPSPLRPEVASLPATLSAADLRRSMSFPHRASASCAAASCSSSWGRGGVAVMHWKNRA